MTSLYDRPFQGTTSGMGEGDTSGKYNPQGGTDWAGNAKKAMGVIGGLSEISSGLNAYALSKINAKNVMRVGRQSFEDHMASVRQAVGSYVQKSAGSGLVKNKDIEFGAFAKGARDAANKMYEARVSAAQMKYEGKVAKAKGISSGIMSIAGSFGGGGNA